VLKSLPLLPVAVLIIILSFFVGSLCRQVVASTFRAMEIAQAELFGSSIKYLVIVTGVLLGMDQVGIDIGFLAALISIFLAAVLGAIALAFRLGARVYVANVLASRQLRKLYRVGDTVMLDGRKGRIAEITATMIILQSVEGQLAMPAGLFQEKMSVLYRQVERDEAR
jgi:small-conductance mechanosensitive channel